MNLKDTANRNKDAKDGKEGKDVKNADNESIRDMKNQLK